MYIVYIFLILELVRSCIEIHHVWVCVLYFWPLHYSTVFHILELHSSSVNESHPHNNHITTNSRVTSSTPRCQDSSSTWFFCSRVNLIARYININIYMCGLNHNIDLRTVKNIYCIVFTLYIVSESVDFGSFARLLAAVSIICVYRYIYVYLHINIFEFGNYRIYSRQDIIVWFFVSIIFVYH